MNRFVLDGVPVAYCEGTFSKNFDMDPKDAEEVVYDDTYVMVVVARAAPPSFHSNKTGDLIRRNHFEVSAAKVADATMSSELAELFDLEIQQKLPFSSNTPPSSPPPPPPPPVSRQEESGPRVAPGMSASTVSTPVGTPVAPIPQTEDEELAAFLAEP